MTPAQKENRIERSCICRVEGVSEADIQAIFASRPDLFGYDDKHEIQEVMF